MAKKKWSELNPSQKTKGIALIKEHEQFFLKDDNGEVIVETDDIFTARIQDEWLHDVADGLVKAKGAIEGRKAAKL